MNNLMENRLDNKFINIRSENILLDEQEDSCNESSLTDNQKESILIESLHIESPTKLGEQTYMIENLSNIPYIPNSQNIIQSSKNNLK